MQAFYIQGFSISGTYMTGHKFSLSWVFPDTPFASLGCETQFYPWTLSSATIKCIECMILWKTEELRISNFSFSTSSLLAFKNVYF